ncbi:MAG: MFS transporter [Acidobacteriota bacterium]
MPASPLPRSVRLLGWTSLLTDAASEAIYPLLPVFVIRVLGGTAVSLGVIEGAADAVSSLVKIAAGSVSDRTGRRKPLVVVGYSLSGLVRPLVALATSWPHVLAVRFADRIGKGLRGAPRDAMLAALAPADARGRVFGFHRAMDHAGAVVGPAAAAAYLWFFPEHYRSLFALAIIPGALAVATLVAVPEARATRAPAAGAPGADEVSPSVRSATALPDPGGPGARHALPGPLWRFLGILSLFTLGNSTDAFLLLRLSEAGLATVFLPVVWAGLHVVKASLATFGGSLSDQIGRVRLIGGGWLLYAVVYAGFATSTDLASLLAWCLAYGVYFALVEGSEKALVADLAPRARQGTAFGWYNAVLGLGSLAASLLFGTIWETVGPAAAFLTGSALAVAAASLLIADRSLASPS